METGAVVISTLMTAGAVGGATGHWAVSEACGTQASDSGASAHSVIGIFPTSLGMYAAMKDGSLLYSRVGDRWEVIESERISPPIQEVGHSPATLLARPFALGLDRGLVMSRDGGATWAAVQCRWAISAFASDPSDSDRVYAVDSSEFQRSRTSGLYSSDSSGVRWSRVENFSKGFDRLSNGGSTSSIRAVTVDSLGRVWVSLELGGVHVSDSFGTGWAYEEVRPDPSTGRGIGVEIEALASDGPIIWAGTAKHGAFRRLPDGTLAQYRTRRKPGHSDFS